MRKLYKNIILIFILSLFVFNLDYKSNAAEEIKTKSPVILIKEGNNYVPLGLHTLNINVKVVGNIATTTTEMIFYNDLERILEGSLYFPLGEGQTISRFALEVNGNLREGVVVPKAKGRAVFETVVREMIDPGLLEWTKGNTFRSRIYPIPAKGYKRLVIAYEQELKDAGKGFLYLLPLAHKDKVKIFSLKTEVVKQNIKPELTSTNQLVNFKFDKWRESYIATYNASDYAPDKQLAFILPRTDKYKKIIIEKDKENGNNYFYIHTISNRVLGNKELPGKITLIWDGSDSAKSRDIEKELSLLDSYFKKIGNLKVNLVVFRNDISNPQEHTIKNGNWVKLKQYLQKLKYDGGTQLGVIDLKKYPADEYIISTDGISNFGESDIKLSDKPVIAINSQLTAEHSYLNYIARKTSGVYINLTNTTVNQALALLLKQPYSFIKAQYSRNIISEVYPSIPQIIIKDFSISGIIKGDNAKIELHFGNGKSVKHKEIITLDVRKQSVEDSFIKRLWAQKKVSELDINYKTNEEQLVDMGKNYGIVTRFTSLIVLERVEDYAKNKIKPPKELMQEYLAILDREAKEKNLKDANHLGVVVTKFNTLKEWWNKQFPVNQDPPRQSIDQSQGRGSSGSSREMTARPSSARRLNQLDNESRDEAEASPSPQSADKKEKNKQQGSSGITLIPWNPDTPYLKELSKVSNDLIYIKYLELKKDYANSSAYFLDVADLLLKRNLKNLALRVLSNIAEMELENHQLLRILGHRLTQLGYYKLAIFIFNEVLKIREEEPQSYRDLALVYARDKQYQKAVDFLWKVVKRPWDSRFLDIEIITLHEMNAIIATSNQQLNLEKIDKRLIRNLPVDIRVVLNWDADNTDMDLWVTDPNGEKCFYSHKLTFIGGLMSNDFTQGYGPEVYLLHAAKKGNYSVEVNYYGNRQQVIAGDTTVQMQLFLNYGRKNQIMKEITLRLKTKKEVIKIGEFNIQVNDKGFVSIK